MRLLKQNIIKIILLTTILFVIGTLLSFIFPLGYPCFKGLSSIGLPFAYYCYDKTPWAGQDPWWRNYFEPTFFLFNLIFWFIVSIFIIWVYKKKK